MKQALLVIDVQKDYFPGGKLPLYQPYKALTKINQMEDYFIAQHLPIIYIQHIKLGKKADFFAANTDGVLFHPQLKINSTSLKIIKHFPDSFRQTNLRCLLKEFEIEQLVICGMMTHMCINATTKASTKRNFSPIVLSDATTTKDLFIEDKLVKAEDVHESYLTNLSKIATVQTVEEFIFN
ncbi:cysteine hydrolase family protein [Enterococcus alishanensis]